VLVYAVAQADDRTPGAEALLAPARHQRPGDERARIGCADEAPHVVADITATLAAIRKSL